MCRLSHVAVTPKPATCQWLEPSVSVVENNSISLKNSSDNSVIIKKQDHIADLRPAVLYEKKINDQFSHSGFIPDDFQFKDFAKQRSLSKSALQQIQIDPDKQLTQMERDTFVELHKKICAPILNSTRKIQWWFWLRRE